ncbi:MAG: hypothetical protein COT71_00245 [Candidatus Andersenbacteria bacterium CG10_big_fil_rev_8_21_14_0_10_54_11]|uniref:Type 4a pilus biogenesis protein PilO n=1 Tax=Candidatus Andersenbacteria bacterium CG10_big_fil_rev_8_21_14_0_10_54_11 TaxID=1974485 RepID=A0A2M6X0J2_9BACT|nr:MAG: hypothetical protein COT71_00245 [Candidatus Andersenbacteria bacterium CG10_big_fil_rev_8_21_14_0_10_54_11]
MSILLRRGGFISVGLATMALFGAAWWLHGRIVQVRGELAAAAAQQHRQMDLNAKQTLLERELIHRADDIARINQLVPQPEELDGVLTLLEGEAKRAGVTVAATALTVPAEAVEQEMKSGSFFHMVPFAITASGEPAALVRFFQAAERLPYLTTIADFSLQAGRASSAVPIGPTGPTSRPPGFSEPTQARGGGELSLTLLVAVRSADE